MLLSEFVKLIELHDLTYEYSDDGSYYVRGLDSLNQIKKASVNFSPEVVAAIWNEITRYKIAPAGRDQFIITSEEVLKWKEKI